MEVSHRSYVLYSLIMVVVLTKTGKSYLTENFYAKTCPMVETLVKKEVDKKVNQEFAVIADTLRLFFHDCFVEGCDASIMIESKKGDVEKNASDNLSLDDDGIDLVMKAKKAVESVCPGVVSCADILVIATRDCVARAGGPWYNVDLGRRDGLISKASRVTGNIPKPTFNLNQIKKIFAKKNLSECDMIALSGAHTVGVSRCKSFANRLHSRVDPLLNPTYAKQLMATCPKNANSTITVDMDPNTPNIFDNVYYKNLMVGKGLFTSDVVLYTDLSSRKVVKKFANNRDDFNAAFITAMRKLGRVGVKIGNQGEIRRDCTAFN
ncbi:peroxidase 55 [Lactuca sativa]|uniref:peroxidase 55 n=1 Tax=Lactuca sativa TaxID=4236 RepID=UPI000CB53A0C|nr:peroxidase 55 [Lactuca sativa]